MFFFAYNIGSPLKQANAFKLNQTITLLNVTCIFNNIIGLHVLTLNIPSADCKS